MGTIPLPKACRIFETKSLLTVAFRGTQVVYWIHPANLYIKTFVFFTYLYLWALWWPDSGYSITDTDSNNISGQIHLQIAKNATICPDNRYLAGYNEAKRQSETV